MKYIKTLVGALVATSLFVTAASADPSTNAPLAQPSGDLGSWTLSLSGQGASALNTYKVAHSTIGGEFQIGHSGQFILPLEAGVRQGIGYSDAGGANWALATKVYSDWTLIKLGNLEFDTGANAGLSYGNQPFDWSAAPEVVTRLYLKKDVDLFGRVEYPFDLNTGKSDNELAYTIGLRVRF